MFEELKKKSIKKSLPATIAYIVVGIVVIAFFASSMLRTLKGHVPFETLAPDQIHDQIVDIKVTDNFGGFLSEYEKNTSTNVSRITQLYYVIWTGDENSVDYRYMAIKVPVSYEKKMDAMAEATLNYETSEPLELSGTITKMDDEEYGYFKDYFMESGWSEEEFEEFTLPYMVKVDPHLNTTSTFPFLFGLLGFLFILFGIFRLIYSLNGGYMNKLYKGISNYGYSIADAEQDYAASSAMKNQIHIGKIFLYYTKGPKIYVVLNEKVVWAYFRTTTHRTNGIKTGTTYDIVLWNVDKKATYISVSSEQNAQEILQYIHDHLPHIVVGYTDELHDLFRQDFNSFLNLLYHNEEARQNSSSQKEPIHVEGLDGSDQIAASEE